MEIMGIITA